MYTWCIVFRATTGNYRKQLDDANRNLEKLKFESEQIKSHALAAVEDSRKRLTAAETLIEQLHRHQTMPSSLYGAGLPPFSPDGDKLTSPTLSADLNLHREGALSTGNSKNCMHPKETGILSPLTAANEQTRKRESSRITSTNIISNCDSIYQNQNRNQGGRNDATMQDVDIVRDKEDNGVDTLVSWSVARSLSSPDKKFLL